MATYEHTVEIERPIEEVLASVTEPEDYAKWQPGLLEVRAHSRGPLRVGREGLAWLGPGLSLAFAVPGRLRGPESR